jgi:hypothetical protein
MLRILYRTLHRSNVPLRMTSCRYSVRQQSSAVAPELIRRANNFRDRIAISHDNGYGIAIAKFDTQTNHLNASTACNRDRYTYAQLLDDSAALVPCMQAIGGGSGSNQKQIAFLCPPDYSYVSTQWAIWQSGHVAVPLSMMRHCGSIAAASAIDADLIGINQVQSIRRMNGSTLFRIAMHKCLQSTSSIDRRSSKFSTSCRRIVTRSSRSKPPNPRTTAHRSKHRSALQTQSIPMHQLRSSTPGIADTCATPHTRPHLRGIGQSINQPIFVCIGWQWHYRSTQRSGIDTCQYPIADYSLDHCMAVEPRRPHHEHPSVASCAWNHQCMSCLVM